MQITPSSNLLSALSAFSQGARVQTPAQATQAPHPSQPQAATTREARSAVQPAAKPLVAEPSPTPFGPKRYQPLGQSIDIRV